MSINLTAWTTKTRALVGFLLHWLHSWPELFWRKTVNRLFAARFQPLGATPRPRPCPRPTSPGPSWPWGPLVGYM
jgi:hypothetical protein